VNRFMMLDSRQRQTKRTRSLIDRRHRSCRRRCRCTLYLFHQ
jgi:hypothetical protein